MKMDESINYSRTRSIQFSFLRQDSPCVSIKLGQQWTVEIPIETLAAIVVAISQKLEFHELGVSESQETAS